MLLLDDDDELPLDVDAAETALALQLGAPGLRAVDAALRRHSEPRWLKVARVISNALEEGGYDPWDDAALYVHVRRVIALVESGALEAQGNLRKPRWSEVRVVAAYDPRNITARALAEDISEAINYAAEVSSGASLSREARAHFEQTVSRLAACNPLPSHVATSPELDLSALLKVAAALTNALRETPSDQTKVSTLCEMLVGCLPQEH